ncbi:MAG: hypothetical protein ACRDPC_06520 [Solirubrobacteraceae bacterium]
MPSRLRKPGSLVAAVAALALLAVVWQVLPVSAATGPQAWDEGSVSYFDASGMERTVGTAAARWNASGAQVRLRRVDSVEDAHVVVETDDGELRKACGSDCLGYTTSIGRPSDGRTRILLASELGGDPRALSVWVAAHELGHVLGLRHRDGRTCSLMSEHAFDTRCAPSLAAEQATMDQLACVPAPADVEVAAAIYGGRPARLDPRCR